MSDKNQKTKLVETALQKPALKTELKETFDTYGIYNILNTVTKERKLFIALVEKQAVKIFLDGINNDGLTDPKDFELQYIGDWNKIDGTITSETPKTIMFGRFEKQITGELEQLIAAVTKKYFDKLKEEKDGK